jgi:hypothetical protein
MKRKTHDIIHFYSGIVGPFPFRPHFNKIHTKLSRILNKAPGAYPSFPLVEKSVSPEGRNIFKGGKGLLRPQKRPWPLFINNAGRRNSRRQPIISLNSSVCPMTGEAFFYWILDDPDSKMAQDALLALANPALKILRIPI